MSAENEPVLVWFRRDFRVTDHPALAAACSAGGPVIPVFILDDLAEDIGAAPKWRLGLGLEAFSARLEQIGGRLILRRGDALTQLQRLIAETGARAVYWSRLYDPGSKARDTVVKAALKEQGVDAQSYPGHLLFEPWTVETKTGGFYKVYTPMWNAVKNRDVGTPLRPPSQLPAPAAWPKSDQLADWALAAEMNRGARVVRPYVQLGEAAARDRLDFFIAEGVNRYAELRDIPSVDGTSRLSENLALGEMSPRQCWAAGMHARSEGKRGAETFLKELVWREFAYHLMHHTPHILSDNWKEGWDSFPWEVDESADKAQAWRQGRTGMPFVDAAMREMYVTGRMHNRGRMIVASYLTKHLMCHWKIGLDWFRDCLIDWDPASNAMGWQWSSGSGPDATPYFRVFNPQTQLDKFDPKRAYVDHWIAEGRKTPTEAALSYFEAIPRHWNLTPDTPYPAPIVTAEDGRKVALSAYENRDF